MAGGRYLQGPDGIRVDVITLDDGHLTFARQHHPGASAGEGWFLVSRHGALVRYCRDIEEVTHQLGGLGVELADLRGPGETAEEAG